MLIRKIHDSAIFKSAQVLMSSDRKLVFLFLLVAVAGAFTEGLGLSMVAPLLEAQGDRQIFSGIPLLGAISDKMASYSPAVRLQITAGVLLGAILLRSLFHGITLFLARYLPSMIQKRLAEKNHRLLLDIEKSYVDQHPDGEIINLLQSIPIRVAGAAFSFATLLWNLILFTILIVMMFFVSSIFLFYSALFVVTFSALYIYLTSRPLLRASEQTSVANQDWFQSIIETINGFAFLKLSGAEEQVHSHHSKTLDRLVRLSVFTNFLNALPQPLLMMCAGFFVSGLIYAIATSGENIPEQLGQLILFLAILMRLLGPVSSINSMRATIRAQANAISLQAQFEKDAEALATRKGGLPLNALKDGIRFEDVSFAYHDETNPAVENLDFQINKGEMIAIVGPSGAGKSTVVNLLAGLIAPSSGRILIDGMDMNRVDLRSWRRHIGVVSQDIFVFNDSIRQNLTFGLDDVDEQRINAALRYASADDFIADMRDGVETVVGDRGARLSGGQRQRLAIARAVLAGPDILLLDEATSHLDSITERAIQAALDHLREGRTLVVIAHRLSTIQKADRIVVLDKGRVIEQGTHSHLLQNNGKYASLLASQQLHLIDDDSLIEAPSQA